MIYVMDRGVKDELFSGHDRFKVLVSVARTRVSEEKNRVQSGTTSQVKDTTDVTLPDASLDPMPPPPETLASILQDVDCSRCKELTNTNSKVPPLLLF
jgi:hypothetical protein